VRLSFQIIKVGRTGHAIDANNLRAGGNGYSIVAPVVVGVVRAFLDRDKEGSGLSIDVDNRVCF